MALPTLSTADEIWTISVTRALECAQIAFKGMPQKSMQFITEKVQELGVTGIVNADEMIEYCVLAYMSNYYKIASKLSNILAFTAYKSSLNTKKADGKKGTVTLQPDYATAGKLVSALSLSAILTYDEFRSLVRVIDPKVEERAIIYMFGDALLVHEAPGVSVQGFLNICRGAGLFGSAANNTEIIESIVTHSEEESKELQKLLVVLWRMSEPLFERRLLEIGARRKDIMLQEFGEMRNKIAEIGRMVNSGGVPQKAMREFRMLAVEISIFGGVGNLGEGWN